jgi:hypothetical protein
MAPPGPQNVFADAALQAAVDRAFAEPDYVDTGDLIDAMNLALDRLRDFGVVITMPDHNDDDNH